MTELDGRMNHYGGFYGLHPLPIDLPVLLVVGNCQAESLRLMLQVRQICAVRIPPVHELTKSEMPLLEGLLARAEMVVTQPIKQDYRGLRVGTGQIAETMRAVARLCVVPVIRFAGLYPYHAIVRDPGDTAAVPPIVAYHDLRHLAEAAGINDGVNNPSLTVQQVRAISDSSLSELRRREVLHQSIVISDVFRKPTFGHMRTINHPGNVVFQVLADRVRSFLGVTRSAPAPDRELLNDVHAPREEAVITAFGLTDRTEPDWRVAGAKVSPDLVRTAHLQWYREHPAAVTAGLERHATTLQLLGLA